MAPKLASRATVVLVGYPPDVNPAPDMRLVRLLMEAVIADHGGGAVRIAVVDGARPDLLTRRLLEVLSNLEVEEEPKVSP